jgi:hypothetical protein
MKNMIMRKECRAPNEQRFPASILRSDESAVIGAHADYRREDFVFSRTQSLAMRELEWEGRLKPLRPWGSNLVANLAFEIFA